MIRLFVLVLALALPPFLGAQEAHPASCDSTLTTTEMRRCAARALETAKRDLNRYVREARRVAANRALLDSAQAAWERFRDVACRAAGSQRKRDTAQPVVVLNCLVDLTRRRMHEVYDHYLRSGTTALPEPTR
jgi:uncharacterized protein YecT (DUF1311 family)